MSEFSRMVAVVREPRSPTTVLPADSEPMKDPPPSKKRVPVLVTVPVPVTALKKTAVEPPLTPKLRPGVQRQVVVEGRVAVAGDEASQQATAVRAARCPSTLHYCPDFSGDTGLSN